MAFIKYQKLIYDDLGTIISGSAAILDTIYGNFGSYHAKHIVREKLGKVLYHSSDKKSGIFLSPTRGLIEYDARKDTFQLIEKTDSRISMVNIFPKPEIHTVFGDVYLLLVFLENSGLLRVLEAVFQKKKDYQRIICHTLHGVLKEGSKITCENFIMKSFASYIVPDIPLSSLKSDTLFFMLMGDDKTRICFFRNFIKMKRESDPNFGKGCYVDSTPLPNNIINNPFNALCCHGVASSEIMSRLILVLDEDTGLPVWYDIIPGNVLDINTIMTTVNDVSTSIDITIDSLVLDAGYISKELVTSFHMGTHKTIIGRMPARKGYPYKELYWKVKNLIGKGKYTFVRNHHAYFGKREEIELFGYKEFAYIYIDQYNALKRYSDYLVEHEEEYREMKDKDKDWLAVKYGYFVLISNIETSPAQLLTDYFGRTEIETVFKTSKEYLELLPLSKWTVQTVRGKILHDIINTIILLTLRKKMSDTGISITELLGKAQSLMCFINNDDVVTVETPSKKVKEYYQLLDIEIPAHVRIGDFIKDIIGIEM